MSDLGNVVRELKASVVPPLQSRGFSTTVRHLEQAASAFARGEWEGANAQTRAFVESLCNDIARRLWTKSGRPPTGGKARAFLQEKGFLDSEEGRFLGAFCEGASCERAPPRNVQ